MGVFMSGGGMDRELEGHGCGSRVGVSVRPSTLASHERGYQVIKVFE